MGTPRDDIVVKYRIRRSNKAKHARITIGAAGDVTVVVPRRYSMSGVPGFIADHQAWIDKQINRIRANLHPARDSDRPTEILLRAVDETWRLDYAESASAITMTSRSAQVRLINKGRKDDAAADPVKGQLLQWLNARAKEVLTIRANQLSLETGLGATRFSIRNQKTRWGSCSTKGTISLNRNLLFLPPPLVRYLIIHELCHTRYMNHSGRFWQLVSAFEADYKRLDKELSAAAKYIPLWAMPGQ